ncbi:TonB-dependent siderophore receptor [uncultured Anaerovibrio sp.]|uniref:TonB-dependent receptor plug domain-containing protein n=1 Tax=uncultured Anaerovibrio sp. TaxID=361586 RepID=UPI002605E128|nr:TonB-dependent receptor [uncultured Anaerovibrio sp.]
MDKIKVLSGIFGLSLIASTSFAADVATFEDEEVMVYGNRELNRDVDTVIDVKDYSGAVQSLPELLRGVAGIQVQSKAFASGAEDMSVKLRGHDSRRFLVLVDGVPQKNAGVMGGSYFSWDSMPVESIERIEITKGAKSIKYGQVNGGVINIITKKQNGGTLTRAFGSKKFRQTALNYNGTSGLFDFGIKILSETKDAVLRNADYSNRQYGFNLKYHINSTDTLGVDFQHTRTNRGLVTVNDPSRADYNSYYPITPFADAFGNAKDTEVGDGSRSIINRNTFNLTYNSQREAGSDFLSYWRVNERMEERKVVDGAESFKRNNPTDLSQGYIYRGARVLNDRHELSFGADYTRYRYGYGWYDSNAEGASDMYPSQKADVYGIYVGDTWKMNNRWTVDYGVRYDSLKADRDDQRATAVKSYSDSSLSPKVNATFQNDERTTTSFSINRIWRAPSMAEYFWYYRGIGMTPLNHNGEEALGAEKGWGYDISVERKFNHKLQSKLSLFYQDYSSFINFLHTKPFNCYMLNGVKIWGFEWENTFSFDDTSSMYLNYTHQHTAKDGSRSWDHVGLNDQLDYRPRHMVSLGYKFEKNDWTVRYDMNFTGSQRAMLGYPYAKPTETRVVNIGGYVIHNLSVARRIGKNVTVNFAVNNLFDKDYCEIYGYPMEKRSYVLTVTRKF